MSKNLLVSLITILLVAITSTTVIVCAVATSKTTLNIAVVTSDSSNDLVKTLNANYNGVKVYSSLDTALKNAESDKTKGIMVLADNYPNSTTAITESQAAAIYNLGIRIYIEYPSNNVDLGISGYSGTGVMGYDRAIVTDAAALGIPEYSLLYVHGAQYVKKTDISRSWLVNATVVGYDTVEFYDEATGALTDCTPYSMLEVNANGNVLVASTKLSQFISARYAPYARWQSLWHSVFSWVAGKDKADVTLPTWTAKLNANYGPDEELADNAYSEAVRLNTEWFLNSGLLKENGTEGLIECFQSGKYFDVYGNSKMRLCLRSDCTGESLGAIALAGALLDNEEYKTVANNLMKWLLDESLLANGERANLNSVQYGLLSWHDGAIDYYYGDDNAKAIIGLILGAEALGTDEYDQRILEAILANFRTTGTNGFRGPCLRGNDLEKNGWEYYYNKATVNYQSHFESLMWACYLWAYNQTGYQPLLERSKTAIGMMMAAYDDTMSGDADNNNEWYWTNGLQQERAKMLLPLAWLVRVEPTEQHIAWLDKMVTDLVAYQDECGAIAEAIGENGVGRPVYTQFSKNSDYGQHESPVIQNNGDPCSDSLYTTGFAVMALNEAYAAMQAAGYTEVANRYNGYATLLSDYHVRIQQVGNDPLYNGAWFRGFDFEKWETYGSDGDAGWGVWCAETGWCQSWISSTLSLQAMNTNMWDYTADSKIEDHFYDTATLMLNYSPDAPEYSASVSFSWAGVDAFFDGQHGSLDYSDEKWAGIEGKDYYVIVDFKHAKAFNSVLVGYNLNMYAGLCTAGGITVSVSDDGVTYTPVGTWTNPKTPQQYFDADHTNKYIERIQVDTVGAKGRYVKVEVKNPGSYVKSSSGASIKTWVACDEIEFVWSEASRNDLINLIESCNSINRTGYTPASVLAFDAAYKDAVVFVDSGVNDKDRVNELYASLSSAKAALEFPGAYTVVSNKNWSDTSNISYLFDGTTGKEIEGKVLTNLTTLAQQELELVIDMGKSTGIYAIGYISESRAWAGIYMPNAEFFVSDSPDGPWVSVGTVAGKAHAGDIEVGEFRPNTAAANGTAGRYVKVTFSYCPDFETNRVDGYLCRAEWVFLHEILINKYCNVNVTAENATVTVTDTEGNDLGILGPRVGQDVKINITPALNTRPDNVTVNGSAVTVTGNSFVISEINGNKNVNVSCTLIFSASDLPTINAKDLFFPVGSSYDLKFDVTAKDKNGKDISDRIEIVSQNVGTTAGKYSVTYRVIDDNGAVTEKTANVYLVSGLGSKYVIASTTLSSRLSNHQIAIQKLLDGKTPAAGTTIWDSNNIYWQNESAIEIIIYLGGETGIADLGYSLLSNPSMGLIAPDVDYYYTSDISAGWTYAGRIEATYHAGELTAIEHVNKLMSLENVKASYVKAVIRYDDDPDLRAKYIADCVGFTGKGAQEWTFVNEIVINPYYKVSTPAANGGSVSVSTSHAQGALYGESATVIFTPDDGYFLEAVKVNGTFVEISGNTYTLSGITRHTEITASFREISIKGAALKHGEAISLIYYAYLPGIDGAEMRFEMNGKSFTATGKATGEANVYAFEFNGIAPQCMGDTVNASLLIDGEIIDTVNDYSVKAYCASLLGSIENKTLDGYTDAQYAALKQLVYDILEYGAAAQVYRNYKTDALVNDGIEGAREFTELDNTRAAVVGDPTEGADHFVSAGVRFDYVNSIFVKFTAGSDATVVRVTDKATSITKEYTLGDCTEVSAGVYILYTDGILPTQFDTVYTIELRSGETVLQTLDYSICAYVYYIQNETDGGALTPMAELARALYNFGISAIEYKNNLR